MEYEKREVKVRQRGGKREGVGDLQVANESCHTLHCQQEVKLSCRKEEKEKFPQT